MSSADELLHVLRTWGRQPAGELLTRLGISRATLMRAVSDNASVVAPILATRSAYSFGALLPPGPKGSVSAGIGPRLINSQVSFFAAHAHL